MPVHIENLETDVTVASGDLPLSEAQIESLVQLVLKRLQDMEREQRRNREATMLRSRAAPDEPGAGGRGWD
jgi:hypothetical protein